MVVDGVEVDNLTSLPHIVDVHIDKHSNQLNALMVQTTLTNKRDIRLRVSESKKRYIIISFIPIAK